MVVLFTAVGALWLWKPWAPDVEVAEPLEGGSWIESDGMVAHYYPAQTDEPGPAVLVLGGSEGGLNEAVAWTAAALQDEGYSAVAMSYFGAPDQPDALTEIDLDQFHQALDWLAQQDEVDPEQLSVYGGSKGAEAALLVASQRSDLARVVANVPSHVAWQGLDLQRPWRMATAPASSWAQDGQPLAYTAMVMEGPSDEGYAESFRAAIDQGVVEESRIDIAAITAPVLLTCGDQDQVWPSCPMAHEIEDAAASGGPEVTVLRYPRGGHFVYGPPGEMPAEVVEFGGGSVEDNEQARADSWPATLEFLDTATE